MKTTMTLLAAALMSLTFASNGTAHCGSCGVGEEAPACDGEDCAEHPEHPEEAAE